MKKIKGLRLIIVLGALLAMTAITTQFTGCANPNVTSYKTIGATETAVYNANSVFLTAVVLGQAPTNNVPTVEAAFNDTQLALHLAAVLASGNTNAATPAAVAAKAQAFITLSQKR